MSYEIKADNLIIYNHTNFGNNVGTYFGTVQSCSVLDNSLCEN